MWYNMSSHLTGTRLFHMGDGILKPPQSVGRKAAKPTSTRNLDGSEIGLIHPLVHHVPTSCGKKKGSSLLGGVSLQKSHL